MAASVVDLPEPVGPVTSTSPRGLSHILLTTGGRPKLVERFDLERNQTEDASRSAALVEDVGAEASQAFQAEGEVQFEVFFEAVLLRIGHHAVGQLLGLSGRQLGQVERHQMSVHADLRRRVGGDVEVASTHLQHAAEQIA